jgi:5,10-methylenetetrahydromethanopterin reductase
MLAAPMRFSVRVNNDLTLPQYVALARAAEGAGFDQLWVSDDLFFRSAPIILAAVAGATERLQIGTGILNPYTIHPSEIAMLAATLDELSGCRFNLGLASGAADFLGWVGLRPDHPLVAVRESIGAIRGLLAGHRVAMKGRFLRWTADAYLRFSAPRQTPIYLGAMSPGMLRLTGELADGALPLLLPPEHYFAVRPHIEEGGRRRPADLPPLDLAACVWVSLAEDRRAARRALAEKIAYYGHALSPMILERLGLTAADMAPVARAMIAERDVDRACALVDDRMLKIGVVGGPAEVIARLTPLVDAGVRHLSFGPPLGPDPVQAVALLGREVLPRFRSP